MIGVIIMRNHAYRKHKELHKFKTRCERWYFFWGKVDTDGQVGADTLYAFMQKEHMRHLITTWTICSKSCCGNPRRHFKSKEKYTIQELRDFLTAKEQIEQINFEKVHLLCKGLPAKPCHEMLVGGLSPPLSKHLKVKIL